MCHAHVIVVVLGRVRLGYGYESQRRLPSTSMSLSVCLREKNTFSFLFALCCTEGREGGKVIEYRKGGRVGRMIANVERNPESTPKYIQYIQCLPLEEM